MSKTDQAKSKCPCGHEIIFQIKKPNFLTKETTKIACTECDSRFLVHVEVDKRKPEHDQARPLNRAARERLAQAPFERNYTHTFEIIRLSAKAKKNASNPLKQAASMVVEKFGKREGGPEF